MGRNRRAHLWPQPEADTMLGVAKQLQATTEQGGGRSAMAWTSSMLTNSFPKWEVFPIS
eukprot:CAMPEP_0183432258 /NCGR_PEP_ID=MMETSP0370-20130417/56659_1 /TAXON_ID=268820 /ORGANISM="Peridinium aciculiferum, Strain PAER-2" /LENGTH=58 /DNA_ID=CAMNT_0025618175 /DNA_START=75 /DNA_END=247 /DNA_ORIENTATION=+